MPFCINCGANIEEHHKFCVVCGMRFEKTGQTEVSLLQPQNKLVQARLHHILT